MSPAQLRYSSSSIEQKEEACSSSALNKEIDGVVGEMSPDTNRYPTRSQPKTLSPDNALLRRERMKRQSQELVGGNLLSHEDQVKTSELSLREPNTKGGTCPKCQKGFQDLHSLTIHVKQHNTGDNTTCGVCQKKLSSASSLDRHMLTHTGEKPFKCKYCPQRFTTNGNMNRHMHTHELEIASRSSDLKANRASEKRSKLTSLPVKKQLVIENGLRELSAQEEDATELPSRKRMKMTDSGESSKNAEVPVHLKVSKMIESSESSEKIATALHFLKQEESPPSPKDIKEAREKLTVKIETRKFIRQNHEPKAVMGFEDLTYMAFSSPKFGLVAKMACEETNRIPNCSQIGFKCQLCERFFPCLIALGKHEAFHQNPLSTVCHACHCHFESPELQEEHMMKHHQNLAENKDIGNADFMAALGLHRRPKLYRLLSEDEPGDLSDARRRLETFEACMALNRLRVQKAAYDRIQEKAAFNQPQDMNSVFDRYQEKMSAFQQLRKKKPNGKKDDLKKMKQNGKKDDLKKMKQNGKKDDLKQMKRNGKKDDDPKSTHMGVFIPVAEDTKSLQESPVEDVAPCRENIRVNADPAMGSCILESPGSSSVQSSNQESSNDFADISSIISNLAPRPGPSSEGSSDRTPHCGSGSETDNYSLRNYLKGYKRKGNKIAPTKVKRHYFCSRCDYKTTEKSSLRRHMLTHDKERPFKCTKCGMTFTTKSNGERHAKTIHRLTKSELITAIDYNLSTNGSNKGQKMCKYCYILFENNRALQHHLRSKTNNCKSKPFICRECRLGFSTKNNCHRHIKNLHKELLHQVKTDVFIIVNKYLKSLARKNKQLHAKGATKKKRSSQPAKGTSVGGSSNSNTSSYESSTSPVQQTFQQQSNEGVSSNSEASSYEAPSPMLQQRMEQQTSIDESSNCETSSSLSPCPNSQQSMEQGMGATVEESTNSEFSASETPSPEPLHNKEVQYSFNEDDRVKAAESLVSLSEGLDLSRRFESVVQQSGIEDSPLDLSIRAIDLTERSNSSSVQRYNVGHSSFNGSISFALLTSPNPPTSRNHGLDSYSAFATPLNLTKKQNGCSNTTSMRQNASTPLVPSSNDKPQPSTSRSHSVSPTLQPKTSKPEVLHECNYCDGKFTQKSNKDRHIRNFHPEHAKPRRNKNFSPSTIGNHASKQASSTLSSATREALLTRVLQHSDGNKQLHIESNHSMNLVIKEEPIPAEEGMNSDLENVDLASVSSVINTANSPKFTQYLTEDCNTFSQRSAEQSSSEPPRKRTKAPKPDGERSLSCDFPTCNKTFNCRSSLKRHSVIHTGERAFECPFCHKQFTTNSNMVRHITNKHKVSPPRRSVPSPAGQATASGFSNGSTESSLHEFGPKSGPMSIPTNQSAWPTSFANATNNSNGNAESVLHGFRSEQTLGELCVSPATRREYPEPNRSPDLPETSQAAMPFASEPLASLRQAFECTFCNTSYKTEADRWNHMKQLHPLEYGKMHGRHENLPDIVSIWKKNGYAKLRR